MRFVAPALLVLTVFVLVTAITASNREELDPLMYDYIVQNFEEDTHAKNAVASILLNYRMYDTMFEALILLAAIIGMNQFLPRESGMRHHEGRPQNPGEHADE
jgi:multisubunit Na+/H+ antiporter MnhB subunit